MCSTFEHDATPTWSGFIYQGEIAIYLAVKKICQLRDAGTSDIQKIGSEYRIEVENCEDIAIVHKHENTREYLSIHQVKNQKDIAISKYASPLIQLMLEKGAYTEKKLGKPNAFLHVSNNVCSGDQNIIINNLNQWSTAIIDYYNKLTALSVRLETENNDELVLQEIKDLVKKEPIKINRIEYKSKLNVITAFKTKTAKSNSEIKEVILQLIDYMKNELCVLSIDKNVKVYKYEDGNTFCNGNDVYQKIVEQVKRYKNDDETISQLQFEYIADKLIHYMRQHVIERHQKSQVGMKCEKSFLFSEVLRILDSTLEHYDEEANILSLRRRYEEHLFEYCDSVCEYSCQKEKGYSNNKCKINRIDFRRTDSNDDDFKKLCYTFNPDCDKTITNRDCINILLNPNGLDDSVFKVIHYIPEQFFCNINDKTKFIINNNEKNALLTAISSKHGKKVIMNIVNAIESNATLVSPIFDADQLITTDLKESESIWNNDYSTIQKNYIKTLNNEEINQNSICIPKKPELIKADDIIKNLTESSDQEAV